jgi:hypothetical protein
MLFNSGSKSYSAILDTDATISHWVTSSTALVIDTFLVIMVSLVDGIDS